jgi:hypothetical protein
LVKDLPRNVESEADPLHALSMNYSRPTRHRTT